MKRAICLVAVIFTTGLLACAARGGVLVMEGFEKVEEQGGYFPPFYKHNPGEHSISIVHDPVRAGRCALKFDFDFADWRKEEPKRAEIYAVKAWGGEGMELRKDWWFGFSQYLPADWEVDETNNADIIWQFHGWEGGPASANPPLSAVVFGDKIYIRLAQGTVPAERAASYLDLAILPLPKGVWMDVVLDVNFDYQNGHVRMWNGGEKIVDYTGPTLYPMIGQVNEKGPGFKAGIYKYDWGNVPTKVKRRTLYLDEVRFGDSSSSFAEMTPR